MKTGVLEVLWVLENPENLLINALHQKRAERNVRPFARQLRWKGRQLGDVLLRRQFLEAFARLELCRRFEGFLEASDRVPMVIANDATNEPAEVLAVEAVDMEPAGAVVVFQIGHGCARPQINRQVVPDIRDRASAWIEQRELGAGLRPDSS